MLGAALKPVPLNLLVTAVTFVEKWVTLWYAVTVQNWRALSVKARFVRTMNSSIPSHYQPPINQNFGAPDKHPDPAYQSMPPIYDIEQSKQVFEQVLQTKLMVLVGELCSISNNIRNQLWTAIMPKRTLPSNITAFQEPIGDLDNALPSFALNNTCCSDHLLNNTIQAKATSVNLVEAYIK